MHELGRMGVEDFKSTSKNPIVVVLDNVRSMNNVGAVFRSSDAFCIEKIVLCGITAKPPHRDINKTALGADQSVEWLYAEKTGLALTELKNEGYHIIGVEQTDESIALDQFPVSKDEKYALVFGNEAFGISDDVLDHLDVAIEIPQYGTKHSLNISVAVGVVLWEFVRKYK